jgi:hypothetical protein
MTLVIRVPVCGKHDEEFNEHGRCPDCCAEDHACEVCGEHTDWNSETESMVCEGCAACDFCGCNSGDIKKWWDAATHSVEYDKGICESCHNKEEETCDSFGCKSAK